MSRKNRNHKPTMQPIVEGQKPSGAQRRVQLKQVGVSGQPHTGGRGKLKLIFTEPRNYDPSINGSDMIGDYTPLDQLAAEWADVPAEPAPTVVVEAEAPAKPKRVRKPKAQPTAQPVEV